MPVITLIQALRQALDSEMERDERVVLIGNDIGRRGGIFGATRNLFEKYGSQRVIDAPVSVSGMVGISIGMALYGFRPVCEIQFAGLIFPAFNQIINEAAQIHYRSCGEWSVPLVVRAPYGGGTGGGLYHSQSVEAYFAHTPGLKVIIPSNPYDAKGLLLSALCDPNPVLFLEPVKGYRSIHGEVPEGSYTVPIGHARITRPGHSLSLITYGMMHEYALRAAERAALDGIEVEVIDVRTLHPLDTETLLESVRKTNRALIVHEDTLTGGFGGEIAAVLADQAFDALDAPVKRLAGTDIPPVPFSYPMQEWFMLNTEKIAAAIRELHRY